MTVFLLGSGVSRAAGMPSVQDITRQVLSGTGAWRHPDTIYTLSSNPNSQDRHLRHPVEQAVDLLDVTRRRVSSLGQEEPNYEDLAFSLQQVSDALTGEYENPAVLPFASLLASDLGIAFNDLKARCEEAVNYIADIVAALIHNGDLGQQDHLGAIIDMCRRESGEATIATLNHDTLMEASFAAQGIVYSDGFAPGLCEIRRWANDWSSGVRLLKLHGSVDWFDVASRQSSGGWFAAQSSADIEHLQDHEIRSPRPTFLTGTFTKILKYQTGIFPGLHAQFFAALEATNHVIAIGYGFGDKAINSHVSRFLDTPSNHMTICDPFPDELRRRARQRIRRGFDEWSASKQLTVVAKGIEDVDRGDLACPR